MITAPAPVGRGTRPRLQAPIAFPHLRPVRAGSHVLDGRTEMTTQPGRDNPRRHLPATRPSPQMTVARLRDVPAAAASVAGKQSAHRPDGLAIYNPPGL
jgi:hypothetical protein